jgi:hypothetical protein
MVEDKNSAIYSLLPVLLNVVVVAVVQYHSTNDSTPIQPCATGLTVCAHLKWWRRQKSTEKHWKLWKSTNIRIYVSKLNKYNKYNRLLILVQFGNGLTIGSKVTKCWIFYGFCSSPTHFVDQVSQGKNSTYRGRTKYFLVLCCEF